jgi:hypothetical protein
MSDFAVRMNRTTDVQSVNTNNTVLRATAILSLLAIGSIHFLQVPSTVKQAPLLGASFLLLSVTCLAVAARLATRGDYRTWTISSGICVAALGGYALTRLFSTPLDNQDVGNWSCMLGLAALFVEATLLAFSVYAALAQRTLQNVVPQSLAGMARPRDGSDAPSAA